MKDNVKNIGEEKKGTSSAIYQVAVKEVRNDSSERPHFIGSAVALVIVPASSITSDSERGKH